MEHYKAGSHSRKWSRPLFKFAIATERLSDKKEDSALEPGAGRSADGEEDFENSRAEEKHDI